MAAVSARPPKFSSVAEVKAPRRIGHGPLTTYQDSSDRGGDGWPAEHLTV